MAGALPVPVGIPELDRVLAGGLVPGSVTLVSGEPGVGKSTLLLQAAAGLARSSGGGPVLYVSAEEAVTQVRRRAERVDALEDSLLLNGDADLDLVERAIEAHDPSVVVVDSVQTVFDAATTSSPGTVAQVRASAQRLASLARRRGLSLVLVGHVTKDGSVAGPRVLEHLVDTVLTFDGDRQQGLRFLRAAKHRFGPTDELGVFTMVGAGLEGVADAGGLFLADRRRDVPGSIVVPLLDGVRPLLVEVQALVVPTAGGTPQRTTQGVDRRRLDLVLAVLAQRAGVGVAGSDVFASVAGGLRANEPGVDLGLALAVASAHRGTAIPHDLLACGEVGLVGEVRQVRGVERRLAEAARLGYSTAIVPSGTPSDLAFPGLALVRVTDLGDAVELATAGARPHVNGRLRSL